MNRFNNKTKCNISKLIKYQIYHLFLLLFLLLILFLNFYLKINQFQLINNNYHFNKRINYSNNFFHQYLPNFPSLLFILILNNIQINHKTLINRISNMCNK